MVNNTNEREWFAIDFKALRDREFKIYQTQGRAIKVPSILLASFTLKQLCLQLYLTNCFTSKTMSFILAQGVGNAVLRIKFFDSERHWFIFDNFIYPTLFESDLFELHLESLIHDNSVPIKCNLLINNLDRT